MQCSTLFNLITSLTIAKQIEKSEPDLLFKAIVFVLFVLLRIQFIVFTQRAPWFDIFTIPKGWECMLRLKNQIIIQNCRLVFDVDRTFVVDTFKKKHSFDFHLNDQTKALFS